MPVLPSCQGLAPARARQLRRLVAGVAPSLAAGVAPPQLTALRIRDEELPRGAWTELLRGPLPPCRCQIHLPALTDFDALFLALPLMELQVLIEYEKGLFGRFPKNNPFW